MTVNIPNSVSVLRILMVPVLVALAWNRQMLFTVVLAASLLMDVLDGYLARRLNQQTRLGAQLDSWGDILTVLVYPFAAQWLQPEAVRRDIAYVIVAAIAYLTPILFGFIKFGRLTSYHTRLMRVAASVMGVAMIAFFAGWSDIPFRAGCFVLVAAQIEEFAISATLPRCIENVPSFRHALNVCRGLIGTDDPYDGLHDK